MSSLTVDTPLVAQLGKVSAPTKLCDPSGRVLGTFLPEEDRSLYDRVASPNRDEELDRRLREYPERPLEDILRGLESRG